MDSDQTHSEPLAEPAAATGGSNLSPQVSHGSAYAVLRRLTGDRFPEGPLGPDTVPASALSLPVDLLAKALVKHNEHCPRLQCPRVPEPLWPYIKWRAKAIPRLADKLYRVLWTHGTHPMVEAVRKQVLSDHSDLVQEVRRGALASACELDRLLSHAPTSDAARRLLGVLWAVGANTDELDPVFRMLVVLTDPTSPIRIAQGAPQSVKSWDRERREAITQRKAAERAKEEALKTVRAKERAINKARNELKELTARLADRDLALAATKEEVLENGIARQNAERKVARLEKRLAALQHDVHEAEQELAELQLQRSELAQQIARDRRFAEQYRLEHKTGAPAVWAFLENEHERLRTEQLITSGGARARVDDEWTAFRKLRDAFLQAHPEYIPSAPMKAAVKSPLRFTAFGGSAEVGRSAYLVELGKRRILIDCGIKPGDSRDQVPAIDQLEHIDALIVTHAHTDHIGWIPALVQKLGDLDIYCSEATAALLPIMLEDCRRHYFGKVANARDVARRLQNADPVDQAYEEEDVRHIPNLVITQPFNQQFRLFDDVKATFYPAGHILGAASVMLEEQSGRRVFVSGDFSSFAQLTVAAAEWPDEIGDVDLLVLESTYGGRVHDSLGEARELMIRLIRETIDQRRGSVILPSFALGRAQELLSLLITARRAGTLPGSIPIYVDGMIKQINPIYRRLAADFSFQESEVIEVRGSAARQEVLLEAQMSPVIIVTTSGMMLGGPVIEYAKHLLPDERHRIVFSGYQDEGAPSRALIGLDRPGRGRRVVELTDGSGKNISIEAAVPAQHVPLSAHADQKGLLEYAARMSPRVVGLVHGDPQAQAQLKLLLQRLHPEAQIHSAPSTLVIP